MLKAKVTYCQVYKNVEEYDSGIKDSIEITRNIWL